MSDVAFGNLCLATCALWAARSTDGRCTSGPPCTSPSGLPSSPHPLGGTCEGRSTSCWASPVPLGCRSGPEGSPCSSSGTRSCRPRRPTGCPRCAELSRALYYIMLGALAGKWAVGLLAVVVRGLYFSMQQSKAWTRCRCSS